MNEHDYKNLLQILSFATQAGLVKSLDDSKVVILLEAKLKNRLKEVQSEEAQRGDDVQGSSE